MEQHYFLKHFQFFGLHYLTSKDISKNWCNIHPKYWLYFAFLVLILTASFIGQMLYTPLAKDNESERTASQKSIRALMISILFSTGIITLFQSIISTKEAETILFNLNKVADLSWSEAFFKIQYSKFQKHFKIKFFGLLLVFFVPLGIAAAMDATTNRLKDVVEKPIFTFLPITLIKMFTIKFVFYVDLINFHLVAIENILKRPYTPILQPTHILENSAKLQRNIRDNLIKRLTVASKLYGIIWECTELANYCFGWSFVLILLFVGCSLISQGYFTFIFVITNASIYNFAGKLSIGKFFRCNS